jgi:hypothetical protein
VKVEENCPKARSHRVGLHPKSGTNNNNASGKLMVMPHWQSMSSKAGRQVGANSPEERN